MIKPKAIIHYKRPPEDVCTERAKRALHNIGTYPNATLLFLFYIECGNGFRPSLTHIHNETGLREDDIHRYRGQLVKRGILTETPDKLFIRWDNVEAFACLDKPIPMGNSYRKGFHEATFEETSPSICHMPQFLKLHILNPPELSDIQKHLWHWAIHLTEKKFYEWIGMNRPAKYIDDENEDDTECPIGNDEELPDDNAELYTPAIYDALPF